jgi:hypothetical protein
MNLHFLLAQHLIGEKRSNIRLTLKENKKIYGRADIMRLYFEFGSTFSF